MQQDSNTERNTSDIITASRIGKLRDSEYESDLARYFRGLKPTANLVRDCATFSILEHHDNGGLIQTARYEILDIERMETYGELYVYDCRGNQIVLNSEDEKKSSENENDFIPRPLIRLGDAFKSSSRRTLARHFGKVENPSKGSVDVRLWSLMFWLDVSRKILEQE